MHRFRKWSDPRRSQVPESVRSSTASSSSRVPPPPLPPPPVESLPALPPVSDFRTSLILPDLSRRFTLLRSADGDPVSLEDLRNKFAEQRARGAENQVSQEEEEMILETLGRLRVKASVSSTGGDSGYQAGRDSVRSTNTTASSQISSVQSSPGGSSKRYSNNLFGSKGFKDYTYIRSQRQREGSGRSAISSVSSASSRFRNFDGLSPEDNSHVNDLSTPSEDPSPNASYSSPSLDMPSSALEQRLSKSLRRDHLRRASLALEEVIREIEEEVEPVGDGEDRVLVPRSPSVRSGGQSKDAAPHNSPADLNVETGTALSFDDHVADGDRQRSSPSPYARSANTSPTPRLPGYIPGMPRPMTPRDIGIESDDQSPSASTTPRATSPRLPNDRASPVIPHNGASGILRRDSIGVRQSVRAASPLSSHVASLNQEGRFVSEETSRGPDESYIDFGSPLDSSILGRRRPASPLSGSSYQPMSVSSRPGTPSNVTWKVPSSPQKDYSKHDGSVSGHGRSGSSVSFNSTSDYQASWDRPGSRTRDRNGSLAGHARNDSLATTDDVHDPAGLSRSKSAMSGGRSLRSPALPDSPFIDGGRGMVNSSATFSPNQSSADGRPQSGISGMELGSPVSMTSRVLRSPTPTQYASRSPTSPAFSETEFSASSKAIVHASKSSLLSSPFSLSHSQPLVLSPLANSSRSSLESAGSSYHSWNAENKSDRTAPLFATLDPQQPAWHDLTYTDKSSSSASGADATDAEDIVHQYAGLTRSDFMAIQDKLVSTAKAKAESPEARERNNSLRRRRPSTSQSIHSTNGRESRSADGIPQSQVGSTASRAPTVDNSSKASALLDSVLDSIRSPHVEPLEVKTEKNITAETTLPSPTDTELSSPSRRRRALTDVLFGEPKADRTFQSPEPPTSKSADDHTSNSGVEIHSQAMLSETQYDVSRSEIARPSIGTPQASSSPASPALAFADQTELAKEVQRKTEAAMAQLKKMPSNPKLNEAGSAHRKRISPNQISSPRLVSASTSVDTIPLRSPSAGSDQPSNPSKLGQRFRKLRGTLRAKPTAQTGLDITPYPLDLLSPASAQTDRYKTASPIHHGPPVLASATELGRFKVPVPSPPASAGPGLKGFMARFRKPRPVEGSEHEHRIPPNLSSAVNLQPAFAQQQHAPALQAHSAPPDSLTFKNTNAPQSSASVSGSLAASRRDEKPSDSDAVRPPSDQAALRQLFDAASNLGLDQAALNDLLARSTSTSSKSTSAQWSLKHTSATTSDASGDMTERTALQRVRSPTGSESRPSIDKSSQKQASDSVRKLSVRKQIPRASLFSNTEMSNAVVRRTLIFPAETRQSIVDFNAAGLRKSTSTRRRRSASAASVQSVRSVHDRIPTPPPQKSPTSLRFSPEPKPPVPELPPSLTAQAQSAYLPPPPLSLEKSNSAYDSLYDMYTGDGKPNISINGESQVLDPALQTNTDSFANLDPNSAVEVLELANGETIWSIVNGLRDDDAESFYGNRASFLSEYSFKEGSAEGVQVFFKEHGRKASKESNNSYISRRKTFQSQGAKRPETKVFFSSSTQIGRLIDNLSQGMESGSFNIIPSRPGASSAAASSYHSESDTHWTVEERLEHMLGSMGTT
ncbi:hypothetical protein DENSPDRAFT_837290 [Dentipellis sp. KUC8613]|nr:hypothetical protein DENSPDRAFT_837290 [Dentipellis sp. KUC8613]